MGYTAIALVLLHGWWDNGPLRPLWDTADAAVFRALNGGMATSPELRMFWAITNSRYFDVVTGLAILACFAAWILADGRRQVRTRLVFSGVLAVFVFVWMHEGMKRLLDFGRSSPTLVMPDAVWIGAEFPWIPKVKDFSFDSFPGDHFGVALMIGLVLCHVAGRRVGSAMLVIAFLLAFPRMAGGAHWFTDQVIGGGYTGLIGAAVFLTPVWWWTGRRKAHAIAGFESS